LPHIHWILLQAAQDMPPWLRQVSGITVTSAGLAGLFPTKIDPRLSQKFRQDSAEVIILRLKIYENLVFHNHRFSLTIADKASFQLQQKMVQVVSNPTFYPLKAV